MHLLNESIQETQTRRLQSAEKLFSFFSFLGDYLFIHYCLLLASCTSLRLSCFLNCAKILSSEIAMSSPWYLSPDSYLVPGNRTPVLSRAVLGTQPAKYRG